MSNDGRSIGEHLRDTEAGVIPDSSADSSSRLGSAPARYADRRSSGPATRRPWVMRSASRPAG